MCFSPNSHTAGEAPSTTAKALWILSFQTRQKQKRKLSGIVSSSLWSTEQKSQCWHMAETRPRQESKHTPNMLRKISFLSFLEAVRQASPAEKSSRQDPVYFTVKRKQRDRGAIFHFERTSDKLRKNFLIETVIHNSNEKQAWRASII